MKNPFVSARAIVTEIAAFVFFALAAFALKWTTGGDGFLPILGIILLVVSALSILLLTIWSVINTVYQLRLNRRAIGFIAAVLLIVVLVGGVLMLILLNNTF